MKTSNLSSRVSEQQKFESENTNAVEQGITRRLLEKYKPKHICNVETMLDRNNPKRVALDHE